MRISGTPESVVIKAMVIGDDVYPLMEIRAGDEAFGVNMGGDDYYAHDVELTREEATLLRDALTAWLDERKVASRPLSSGTGRRHDAPAA